MSTNALRLRMKIWTDSSTAKRYLVSVAFMRDVVNGRPVSDIMCAYAMSDDDTKLITLRGREYDELPYVYFEETGPAPRAVPRELDVVNIGDPRKRPS